MVGGLGPVFHLAQTLVDVSCGLPDGLCKELRGHKVGAGAGGRVLPITEGGKPSRRHRYAYNVLDVTPYEGDE